MSAEELFFEERPAELLHGRAHERPNSAVDCETVARGRCPCETESGQRSGRHTAAGASASAREFTKIAPPLDTYNTLNVWSLAGCRGRAAYRVGSLVPWNPRKSAHISYTRLPYDPRERRLTVTYAHQTDPSSDSMLPSSKERYSSTSHEEELCRSLWRHAWLRTP